MIELLKRLWQRKQYLTSKPRLSQKIGEVSYLVMIGTQPCRFDRRRDARQLQKLLATCAPQLNVDIVRIEMTTEGFIVH